MFSKIINDNNYPVLTSIFHVYQEPIVDVCITSPPYKDSDGYTEELMRTTFSNVFKLLKEDGLFFLNFGHLAEDKFRPFRVCQIAMECGFHLNETITWVKNHYRPIQGQRRMNNLSEFIFLMVKNPNKFKPLNRLAIGIPYADKSNVKRFAGGRDLKCAGNVWYIPYETINAKEEKLHNDRFPLELPLRCLKLSGLKNGLVLDPFGGSCTVGVAAKTLGLDYLMIEKNPIHVATGQKRLDNLTSVI